MNITIRPMTQAERKYSYTESAQLMVQTGCIGHLRGNMGSTGEQFFTSWDDHQRDLKTDGFKAELDAVINALRFDAAYGCMLSSLDNMRSYCQSHPENAMDLEGWRYGFRGDTDKYSYMLCPGPHHEIFDIYCYIHENLDKHMKEAEQGIRFVDLNHKTLFLLKDGDSIRITAPDGRHMDFMCRFVDKTHLECGILPFHIRDFAKRMDQAGNTVIPLQSSLPEKCFAVREPTGEIILIHRGTKGYTPTGQHPQGMSGQEGADALNKQIGVTKAQAAAMLAGSMFGWACPGADPDNYDAQGQPVKGLPAN